MREAESSPLCLSVAANSLSTIRTGNLRALGSCLSSDTHCRLMFSSAALTSKESRCGGRSARSAVRKSWQTNCPTVVLPCPGPPMSTNLPGSGRPRTGSWASIGPAERRLAEPGSSRSEALVTMVVTNSGSSRRFEGSSSGGSTSRSLEVGRSTKTLARGILSSTDRMASLFEIRELVAEQLFREKVSYDLVEVRRTGFEKVHRAGEDIARSYKSRIGSTDFVVGV